LENATIVIANTRTMIGNRYVVEKDTKSLAGERDLPLPALVLGALKAFRALQAEERLALGEAYTVSRYVLADEAGDAFTIKQLRRRAYRLMELLGLRRVRLYDARSSCFTFLANNGVPGPYPRAMGRTYERKDDQAVVRQAGCRRSSRSRHHLGWPARGRGGGARVSHADYQPSDLRAVWPAGLGRRGCGVRLLVLNRWL
jgi:integrase